MKKNFEKLLILGVLTLFLVLGASIVHAGNCAITTPANLSTITSSVTFNISGCTGGATNNKTSNVTIYYKELNPDSSGWTRLNSTTNSTNESWYNINLSTSLLVDGFVRLMVVGRNGTQGVDSDTATGDASVTFRRAVDVAFNSTAQSASCTPTSGKQGSDGTLEIDCKLTEETNTTPTLTMGGKSFTLTANTSNSGYTTTIKSPGDLPEGIHTYTVTSWDIASSDGESVSYSIDFDVKGGSGAGAAGRAIAAQQEAARQAAAQQQSMSIFGGTNGGTNKVVLIVIAVVGIMYVLKKRR